MTALFHFPVERLGWTLLHFLWQGTAIAILYGMIRAIVGRSLSAQARYLLASAALVLMTIVPAITFALNPAGESRLGFAIPIQEPERLLPAAVVVWLAGVLGFSIRLIGGWRLTARLRSASSLAPSAWQQTVEGLAAALRVKQGVQLLVSPLVEIPVVVGWLRPAILVPLEFLTGLPSDRVRAILAHELAHVLRNDYLVSILQGIAETVLFYHPAVWWISKQMRAEREQCCDDLAVAATGDLEAYARGLAELEARKLRHLNAGVAANGGSLVRRIRRLIDPSHAGAEDLPGPAAAWAMLFLWLAGVGAAAVHAAPAPVASIVVPHAAAASTARHSEPAAALHPLTAIARESRKALLYDPVLAIGSAPSAQPREPNESQTLASPLDNPPAVESAAAGSAGLNRLDTQGIAAPRLIAEVKPPMDAAVSRTAAAELPLPTLSTHDQEVLTFHAAARLVLVDVVAAGKRLRASRLSAQDFALFDNGAPRDIAFFSASAAQAPPSTAVAAGAASNRLGANGAPPGNATVLLIDQTNTAQADQAFALGRITRFLENRQKQQNRAGSIGIYTLSGEGSLQVVQELTSDDSRLSQAIRSIHPRPEDFRDREAAEAARPILRTNDVLEAIARHLAEVPGRKNLVWITSGFPQADARGSGLLAGFNPRMEETARILTDANLALYAVDARGLTGSLEGATAVPNAESRGWSPPLFVDARFRPAGFLPGGIDVFARLAELTGGVIFSNTNGIESCLQRALEDTGLNYTLGFYAAPPDESPAWHKLKIAVRQPGVRVRYREKYFSSGSPAPEDGRAALQSLLKEPLDATQLQLIAQAEPDAARPGFSQVQVSIDLRDVHLEKQNNAWVGALDVSFLVEGSHLTRTVARSIRISTDQLEAALEQGVSVTDSVAVDRGGRELRIVAQDRATGSAGSVTILLNR